MPDRKAQDAVDHPDRLEALRTTELLDSGAEEAFDRYTRLAATILEAPVALVSLVDTDRQFFKSCTGLPEPWNTARQTPLSHSFCQHAVASREPLIIDDAPNHALVRDNLAIPELGVAAYLGIPLITSAGHALGALCVIDNKPRKWSDRDVRVLRDIAAAVITEIELRAYAREIERQSRERQIAERRLQLEHTVTLALAGASDLQDATRKVLEALRETYSWDWAALWIVDREAAALRCEAVSYFEPSPLLDEFDQLSRTTALERGIGLPGRVWATGEPAWVADVQEDANFPRQRAARQAGLHGGFCLALVCDGEIVGAMEFLTRDMRTPDEPALIALESIGRQIGQYVERLRAETALRHNEARLAAVIQTSLDCILGMDHEGRVTEWNPAAEQTFGFSREEAMGREMADLIVPHHLREQHRQGLGRCIATGVGAILNTRLELTALRKDGAVFPIELTVTRLITEGPPAFTGYLRDITSRKTDQEEVERGRALFKSIADMTPDILAVYDMRAGVPVYTNREIASTLGYSPEEVLALGNTVLVRLIHPDDLPRILRVFAEFDTLGDGEVSEFEYRAQHKDGTHRWLLNRTVVFTRTPDGRAHQMLSLAQDVTLRKQSEDRLRESEERLRLGLDAGNTGTWDWDIVNDRVTWSERVYEFHGLTPETFDGRVEGFQKLIHPEDAERVAQAIRRSLATRLGYQVEFRIVRPDGRVRWLTTTGKAHYDEDGKPVRMVGATRDITENKRTELERDALLASERAARSEAERANRLKDDFLATVSHELRTPLNAILGYAQLLRRRTLERDVAEGLEVIERNARVQTEIINDLLDMSRIISGKLRLDVQRVELPAVIDAALETVRTAADARGIRLVRTVDPLAGPVSGDPGRLQQVIWNLLTNAVKFTPKGGRVQIVLGRVNSHVEISVSDTGQGIAPSFLPYLFEKFRQSDASATRTHGGLGLGLALVKNLVEMHGGTVHARSPGEGGGATFIVELPLSAVHAEPTDATRQHPRAASSGAPYDEDLSLEGVTVLAVDDEHDSRELVRRILEERGARVITAASAADALLVLEKEPVDLLLSDIGMPGVDGYELVRRVRSLPPGRGGDVPAAALTAFARSEDRTRALIAGYQTHIAKPVEAVELAAAVASLARRRGAAHKIKV